MTGKELLPLIKASSRTDRYSENLMKWVRKNGKVELFVAFATEGDKTYDRQKTQAGSLYVGYGDLDQGWLHGARLSEILCRGVKATGFAYPPKMRFVAVDDWWQHYIAYGKCAIDPEHKLYHDAERWHSAEDKTIRRCVWCWDFYQQEVVKMVERKVWRDIPRREVTGGE